MFLVKWHNIDRADAEWTVNFVRRQARPIVLWRSIVRREYISEPCPQRIQSLPTRVSVDRPFFVEIHQPDIVDAVDVVSVGVGIKDCIEFPDTGRQ